MSLLRTSLRSLFNQPCLILILGKWRTGKTDFSLLIAELALKWKLIDKVASNIYTFNDPRIEHITSLGKLKRWLHADHSTKLYIFDEALAHLPSRTAMSHKNIGILKLLAELSKGHGRMILCSQTHKIDSALRDHTFLRGVIIKRTKKIAEVYSDLWED